MGFQSTKSPSESLFNVEKDEIDIQRKCVDRINVKPIPGTIKIHSIEGVRPYGIKMGNLSCFCTACWADN